MGDVQSWIRPGWFPDPGLAGLGQGTQLSRGGGEPGGSKVGSRVTWLWLPSCSFPGTKRHLPSAAAGAARQPGGRSPGAAVDPGRGGADPRLRGRRCLRPPVLLLRHKGTRTGG